MFINYNGLRDSHLSGLSDNGRINPFDNKVIIIDEAHNFVSRIVNKLGNPASLSMKLYEFLLSAKNCRLVFLTGTPIINYPNEISILFNMLRGYIKTFIFYLNVQTTRKINQASVEEMFSRLNIQDYVQYNSSAKTLVITRNPFGFISKYNKGLYKGVKIDHRGDISDTDFVKIVSSVLRNNDINVLKVEEKNYKSLPDTLNGFNTQFIDSKTGDLKNYNLLQRRILGLTSYFRSAREELMPTFDIDKDLMIEEINMSDYQFAVYEVARSKERLAEKDSARKRKSGGNIYEDSVSTYRIFSRAFCNFVFPREIGRPLPQEDEDMSTVLEKTGADEDILDVVGLDEKIANIDGKYEEDDADALKKIHDETVDSTYEERIQIALEELKVNSSKYLSVEGLSTYSPKFLEILNNILNDENRGSHLIYSQFRTLEGIGIFKLVLEQNGFIHFKLKKSGSTWQIDIPDDDIGKPAFALYTGTEDAEEKEILRNIFNGDWDKIPVNIRDQLQKKTTDNNYGEIIRVLMITSSGAEGITLKNTRFVHIMEPYWHPVRIEQVIGRARRICSHQNLPEKDRTVKVFIYLMVFSSKQLVPAAVGGMAPNELLQKDVSKADKKTPFTSDQTLYEISTIKEEINKQILRAVKSSAMDCALHSQEGDKESIVCLSFGSVSPNTFTTTPALTIEREFDKQQKQNLKRITWKATVVKLGQKRYAFKPDHPKVKKSDIKSKVGEIYDLDSYLRARKHGGNPILKGYLRVDKSTDKISFEEI